MAERSNDVMISTCICCDALLTVEAWKNFPSGGETLTFHYDYPSLQESVNACYLPEDTLDDSKAHFSTSAYTFLVVHLFLNLHINMEYEITIVDGVPAGAIKIQPYAKLRLLSYVMPLNVNCLEEGKENSRLDVGEFGTSQSYTEDEMEPKSD